MFARYSPGGATAEAYNNDLYHWKIRLPGPPGAYEGGVFTVEVTFPESFPFSSPSFHFVPPIFHPNVVPDTGEFDIGEWRPDKHIYSVFQIAVDLLIQPELCSPLNIEAYLEYHDNYNSFVERVQSQIASLQKLYK